MIALGMQPCVWYDTLLRKGPHIVSSSAHFSAGILAPTLHIITPHGIGSGGGQYVRMAFSAAH